MLRISRYSFRHSFIQRALLVSLGMFLLIAGSGAFLVMNRIVAVLGERTTNTNAQIFSRVADTFSQRYEKSHGFLLQIYSDAEYMNELFYMLSFGHNAHLEYRLRQFFQSPNFVSRSIDNFIWSYLAINPDVSSIVIESHELGVFFEYRRREKRARESMSRLLPRDSSGRGVLSGQNADGNELITFYFPLRRPASPGDAVVGTLFIDFDAQVLRNVLSDAEEQLRGHVIVRNPSQDIVFTMGNTSAIPRQNTLPLQTSTPHLETEADWNESIDVQQNPVPVEETEDWIQIPVRGGMAEILGQTNRSLIIQDLIPVRNLILFLTSLIAVALAVLLHVLHRRLGNRIDPILASIAETQSGRLPSPIEPGNRDEFGQIAESLNLMTAELNAMMSRAVKLEVQQRTAVLEMLQFQINPHFLYNTLEAIRMTAALEGGTKTSEMIFSLSRLFRSVVRSSAIIGSLNEEIETVKTFVALFRYRFPDRFQVSLEIDETLGDRGVIRCMLQPLVENFFEHALDVQRTDNLLRIAAREDDEILEISVVDNGKGIDAEALREIHRHLAEDFEPHDVSIGIANVHERVRLVFGHDAGLSIRSESDEGTRIVIRMPSLTVSEAGSHVPSIVGR